MAKDYKDHTTGAMVAGRSQRLIARLMVAVLLVTIGALGYNYWVLLTSHKETTSRMTLVKADLDSALSSRQDLTKMLETCTDELKMARDERKQLKDSEATNAGQLKTLQEQLQSLGNEKNVLEQKLNKEIAQCQETSKQEVESCNASCVQKVDDARKSEQEACQRQQVVATSPANVNIPDVKGVAEKPNNSKEGQENHLQPSVN